VPVKDVFKFTALLIKGKLSKDKISIADFGCAVGSFPTYLKSQFPQGNIVGYEYLESLLEKGKELYPDTDLRQGSILDGRAVDDTYDFVTCLGVLSIFDDIELPLSNLCHWVKPSGRLILHGMYNPDDVDVYFKYQLSGDYGRNECQSGWNIVSQNFLTKISEKFGARNIVFQPFNIFVDLERNDDDPTRSWTETLLDGSKQIVNGLCIKQPHYVIEVLM
jgi:2-polyprenyl-3-methyl-5-hydroxy-6-metoxy-1,4-benzoquinol methylase